MSCCSHNTRTSSPPTPTKLKTEILLQIPNARTHLAGESEAAVELSHGDFSVFHLTEDSVPLATIIKVGNLSWPLTKDEPVIRLDKLHYLFTIPDEEAGFLNYGVSFAGADENQLASLEQFLKQNSCFSDTFSAHSSSAAKTNELCWKDYAPDIEDYNGVLAKAIAQGTGEIVKGIFKLSNEYSNQVQKGASLIKPHAGERKNGVSSVDGSRKRGSINNTLKRQREYAEKRAFAATSVAVTKGVSKRMGESAGEATDDVLATAGHAIGTAWNVFKLRKAINPKASVASNIINNAARKKS